MIDALLSYPSEADALSDPALAPWISDGAWDSSRCFPGVTLVVTPTAFDAGGNQTQAQINFPGWWLVISVDCDTPDPRLTAIEPCRLCAWREAAERGEAFLFQEGLRAAPEQIAAIYRIDGLPAGSAYPFGSAQIIA